MKTQDTDIPGTPMASLPAPRKHLSRLAGIGAILVVLILIGISAIVFAQLAQRHTGNKQGPPPGQWVQVLNGYNLTSLAASHSDPSVLYACAAPEQSSLPVQGAPTIVSHPYYNASFTILRSSDSGTHWQDIGAKAGFAGTCQFAINPANSNEVYVVSEPGNVPNTTPWPAVLKHTTDGGHTWNTIVPILRVPSLQYTIEWRVEQISIVGNRLFGVQAITGPMVQPGQGIVPRYPVSLLRLVISFDGGHTWIVLDNTFHTAKLGVRSYVVDPSNPNTIYELVGRPVLPVESPPSISPVPPPMGTNGDLYKTTDSGAHWQLVLKDLPFGSQVQLASNKPELIYAGRSISPLPLTANRFQPQSPSSTYPEAEVGSFHLHVSTDGGTTWREVAAPPETSYVQSWLVGPNGRAYVYSGNISGDQSTAIASTAVPAGTVIIPPGRPQNSVTAPKGGFPVAQAPTTPPTLNTLLSYDPATDKWSKLLVPQMHGTFLAVTATSTGESTALWFMTSTDGKETLYRYIG